MFKKLSAILFDVNDILFKFDISSLNIEQSQFVFLVAALYNVNTQPVWQNEILALAIYISFFLSSKIISVPLSVVYGVQTTE